MRNSLLITSMLAALLASAGCDSEPEGADDLAESLAVWQDMKAADDGTYGYTRTYSSFSGFRSTTTLAVENDVVVRRTYEEYNADGVLFDSYAEQGAAVGTEQRGAPAYTIDEVYEVCRDEVLTQDPDDNFITLTFHDDGILENCTYFPKDCADDCDTGVEISSLDMNL